MRCDEKMPTCRGWTAGYVHTSIGERVAEDTAIFVLPWVGVVGSRVVDVLFV